MSILLVHLTDWHVVDRNDAILTRAGQLRGVIAAELDEGVDAVHIVVGGDATQSGTAEQFELAEKFLLELRQPFERGERAIPVEVLVIPGNHDCDLQGDLAMRDVAISSLKNSTSEGQPPAGSIASVVLGPLSAYSQFASRVAPDAAIVASEPFYRCVQRRYGTGSIAYHLFNTAWMSRREELPGSLLFPWSLCPGQALSDADVSIAVLHHPFNWFVQPACYRPLRDRVESIADLVLSGHEHSELIFGKEFHGSGTVQYVEGAVLFERSVPNRSGFHVLRIDLAQKRVSMATYSWTEQTESPHYASLRRPLEVNLSSAPQRTSPRRLRPDFESSLDDTGLPVHHRYRGPLKLRDYFIYPDLRVFKTTLHDDLNVARVRSEDVVQHLLDKKRTVIAASDKSGRSSLAKRLYADLHQKGLAPLLLRGSRLPRSGNPKTIRERLGEAVLEQYEHLSPQAYEQLPPGKRVLIVDDLHRTSCSSQSLADCLSDLDGRFELVVLLVDELFYFDELAADPNTEHSPDSGLLPHYSHAYLLPFGQVRSEQLIRKWVALGSGEGMADVEERVQGILAAVEDVQRTVTIPMFPWVLLVLIQQADSPEPPMASSGSYGHYLNAIITAALNRCKRRVLPINGMYNYLGELALDMFLRRTSVLPPELASEFHTKYCAELGLPVDQERLHSDLSDSAILLASTRGVSFLHKYTFCFFVAWGLAQRMNNGQSEAIEHVRELSQNLYQQDAADVVVFLAHLTTNRTLLDEMTAFAAGLFANFQPTDLESGVSPINQLSKTVRSLVLPDGDPDENRRKLREVADDHAATSPPASIRGSSAEPRPKAPTPQEKAANFAAAMQVASALRSIEILGQVLRNGATVRKLDEKCDIARAVFQLAKRLLGFMYGAAPQSLPGLIDRLERQYRERFPEAEDHDVVDKVSEHIYNLYWFSTYAVMKHVASAVGDANLSATLQKVLRTDDTIADRLFEVAIQLDRPLSTLPFDGIEALESRSQRNHLARSVLRSLVAEHLFLYRVPEPQKQRLCDALDIKRTPRMFDPKEKKLLTSDGASSGPRRD